MMESISSEEDTSLGTVRANRVPNIKLSSDAELKEKKVERGYSEEYVGSAFGIDISNVLWQDNKPVRLLSTYVGVKKFRTRESLPHSKSIRWDRKAKRQVDVDCPYIIKEYIQHMGGVDLVDGLLGRYHIRMKTKKWTNRIFYHMLDVLMVNAYILHQRLHKTDRRTHNIDLPSLPSAQKLRNHCVYLNPRDRWVALNNPQRKNIYQQHQGTNTRPIYHEQMFDLTTLTIGVNFSTAPARKRAKCPVVNPKYNLIAPNVS